MRDRVVDVAVMRDAAGERDRARDAQAFGAADHRLAGPRRAKIIDPQVERGMTPPPPEDDSDRRQAAAEEGRVMIARLPLDEQPGQLIDDPGLAAILARIGRAIMDQERDSERQNESSQS